MKRVTWSPDIVERPLRTRSPPITSIGSFIVYLMNAQFKNIPTERACITALKTYTERGRSIFTAAEFAIPYCVDERLQPMKLCLACIAYPFSNPNVYEDIPRMRTMVELVVYVESYSRVRDRTIVYKWILAFTKPRHDLIKYIIHNTHHPRHRSSHVVHSPRNCRGTFRKKETRQQECVHR